MNQTLVVVSGYFNPVHIGHIRYIEEASKLGDKLLVIVNNDRQQILKKGKVIMNEDERMHIVKALKHVDEVFLSVDHEFPVSNSLEKVVKIHPHFNKIIFANGGDRESKKVVPETDVCKKCNIEMQFGVGGTDKLNSSSNINQLKGEETNPPNPEIFKAYDIRGEWNKDWDSEFVYKIGKAISQHFKPKVVSIGRDMRESGNEIMTQLSKALIEEGINVIDLGLCGTELSYFSSSFIPEVDLAIMITASHNPSKDNGLKITKKGSISIGLNSGLAEIRDLALNCQEDNLLKEKGQTIKKDIWQKYKDHVFKLSNLDLSSLNINKIVIDAGNGVGGFIFDKILDDLPIEVVKMFWEPDGNFPNHPADPFQEKNVADLKKRVISENADLGIALDGDSDRVFFIDSKGRYLPGYYYAALMADFILQQNDAPEKETIVCDPRYYQATKDIVEKYGAKHMKSKAGHTLIKEKMREHNSIFAAECSGHIFYRNNNYAESSVLTILLMIKLISQRGPLAEQINHFEKQYLMSGEINFKVGNVSKVLQKIEEIYAHGTISKLDGVGIDFPEWRFNLRGSNTQPLIRLNIEANSLELVNQKVEELKQHIGGEIADH